MNSDYLSLKTLSLSLESYQESQQSDLKVIGDFLQEYRTEKNYFKEPSFSFNELANYFFEHKYTKGNLTKLAPFLTKLRKYYNFKTKGIFLYPGLIISNTAYSAF